MDAKLTLLLLGGLISLVSALSGIILQHVLAMKKLVAETRQHPFRVVYNKQTEFFDALAPILLALNSYITFIDVWLGETSNDAPAKVELAATQNQAVAKFDDLLQRYYMYLPEKLLQEANQLRSECMFLSSNPNTTVLTSALTYYSRFKTRSENLLVLRNYPRTFSRPSQSRKAELKRINVNLVKRS